MVAIPKSLVILSLVLFLASLVMPVSCCIWGVNPNFGFIALIAGWMYFTESILKGIPWLSNLLIIATWVCLSKNMFKVSTLLSATALSIASLGVLSESQSGEELLIGAYAWLLSMAIAFIASITALISNATSKIEK